MNKKELAAAIAEELEFDIKDVVAVLDSFEEVVTESVKDGDAVMLTGFCKFVRKDLPERMVRNPATGERFMANPSSKARITPLKRFKDTVMEAAPKPAKSNGKRPLKKAGTKAVSKPAIRKKNTPVRKKKLVRR